MTPFGKIVATELRGAVLNNALVKDQETFPAARRFRLSRSQRKDDP